MQQPASSRKKARPGLRLVAHNHLRTVLEYGIPCQLDMRSFQRRRPGVLEMKSQKQGCTAEGGSLRRRLPVRGDGEGQLPHDAASISRARTGHSLHTY
jgi:hypothetical protein